MPIKLIFFMTMLMGLALSLSSNSWLIAWVGLEINLAAFVPLMMQPHNKISNESALKYFLTQSLASSFMMLGVLLMSTTQGWMTQEKTPSLIIVFALMLKMGAAPLHLWFPPTMEGLTWLNCIILSTIQKIPTMFLLAMAPSNLFTFFIVFSATVGALGGFNQTSLRKILAYSSIGHMSWMLATLSLSPKTSYMYLLIYIYLTALIMMMLMMKKTHTLAQLSMNPKNLNEILVMMNILSLGGLPPLLGFMPKWMVIQETMNKNFIIIPSILILASLITLYYYMQMTYKTLASSNIKNKMMKTKNELKNKPLLTTMALLGLLPALPLMM